MFKGLSLLAATEMGGAVRRRAVAIGYFAAATLIAGIGCIYALNALHEWLTPQFSSIYASLMIAGGFLAVALILALAGMIERRRKSEVSAATAMALVAAPLAARSALRMNAGTLAAVAALGVGVLFGRQIIKS